MARTLYLGEGLRLPADDAQTQTLVVYGGKGMGKTNFAAVFAEELSLARLRFSLLDPVGVSWGLSYGADGKSPGIEVLRIGGARNPDLKLVPSTKAAEATADLVCEEDVSTLIDISRNADGTMWTKGEKIRFVRDYCTRLYMRQGEKRRPIMQIIDEAGRFVPQQIPKNAEDIYACIGAIEELVELGRNVGIGVALITQRSARMNKSVSELAEMMVAFRTVGPNSIDAILDWFGEHVPRERQKALIERVRQLAIGTALVVSPGWLGIEGEYAIRQRFTFDSSATPKSGKEHRTTGRGAVVDRDKYRDRMSEVEEAASANNPKELHKRIRELDRQLKQTGASLESERAKPKELAPPERIDVPTVPLGLVDALSDVAKRCSQLSADASILGDDVSRILSGVRAVATIDVEARAGSAATARPAIADRVPKPRPAESPSAPERRLTAPGAASTTLPKGEHLVLVAAASYAGGITREQATLFTRYKRSTRDAYIQRLRERGFVEIESGRVIATTAGVDALGSDYEPLPTGVELQRYWLERLPEGEAAIFGFLLEAWPDWVGRDEISERTGYKRSTRDAYLQRLRTREIISTGPAGARAKDDLFGLVHR